MKPKTSESCAAGRVLLIDDNVVLRRALRRVLGDFDVHEAGDVRSAKALARELSFDAVVCDLHLPDESGLALLRHLREQGQETPFVLLTGGPDMTSAMDAVELGACCYLSKPVDNHRLIDVVARASRGRQLVEAERKSRHGTGSPTELIRLEASFDRAMTSLWMAYQPIVASDGLTVGYEALMRSDEPDLPHPGAVLDAAERLDRIDELGHLIRQKVNADVTRSARRDLLFLNLHPQELMDERLLDPEAPMVRHAARVVLEITERQVLGDPSAAALRVAQLRERGYAVAIDDLGAGYASLNAFAELRPDFVKLDMTLVRSIHKDVLKKRLVGAMVQLCRDAGIAVVAEGVETVEERDVLLALGCDMLQGYLFAKPGRGFPCPTWLAA